MTDLATVARLGSALSQQTGLRLDGPGGERVLRRLGSALDGFGVEQAGALAGLERDPQLFQALIAAATVRETYFFREPDQLAWLAGALGEHRGPSEAGRPLRLWSAGCASGEEAYSLAVVLAERGRAPFEILATDLCQDAIESARRAVYRTWSLRGLDPNRRAAYFRGQQGAFRLEPGLGGRVRFAVDNLAGPSGVEGGPGSPGMDAVLCRNVLLYLTPEGIDRVARRLAAALAPGGWLLTASTDPDLSGHAGLTSVRTPFGIAYRRAPTLGAVPGPARLQPARPAASVRAKPPPAAPVPSAAAVARQVAALGDAGRVEVACRLAAAAVADHPLDGNLRRLYAVALLAERRWAEAAAEAKAAIYLAPDHPDGYAVLGHARRGCGRATDAARSLGTAASLAARRAESRAPAG